MPCSNAYLFFTLCLYQKKKKKLFTLCCMCQESITIQQIRKDMIKKDLYRSTL